MDQSFAVASSLYLKAASAGRWVASVTPRPKTEVQTPSPPAITVNATETTAAKTPWQRGQLLDIVA